MIRRLFSSALKKGKLKKKIIPKDSNSLPKIVDSFENSEATEAEKVDGSMLFPREIVKRLDQHIIAQQDAKKAVAIALRDRWRRSRIDPSVKSEVLPVIYF
jgi:ATP-dependent protease Clp ATPase subunit